MWPYAGIFAASLLVDSIPVFAPPAWTLILLFTVRYKLDVCAAAAAGAAGSTIGRYLVSRFMPKIARRLFNTRENANIAFIGSKLGGPFWRSFAFVFVYALTPLSTTALFTAAGVAKVNPLPVLPGFFLGKFLSDGLLVLSGRSAVRSAADLLRGQSSPLSILLAAAGCALILALLFVDWRELIERRRLRFRFNILR